VNVQEKLNRIFPHLTPPLPTYFPPIGLYPTTQFPAHFSTLYYKHIHTYTHTHISDTNAYDHANYQWKMKVMNVAFKLTRDKTLLCRTNSAVTHPQ
jgi:hypothetical protein